MYLPGIAFAAALFCYWGASNLRGSRSSGYRFCASLCRVGAWAAGIIAFMAVIYPFLLQ